MILTMIVSLLARSVKVPTELLIKVVANILILFEIPLFSRLICEAFYENTSDNEWYLFSVTAVRAVLVAIFAVLNWILFSEIKIKTE